MSSVIGQDSLEEGLGELLVVGPKLPVGPELFKVRMDRFEGLFAPEPQPFTVIPERKYFESEVCLDLSQFGGHTFRRILLPTT